MNADALSGGSQQVDSPANRQSNSASPDRDRRDSRWDEHRRARREQLVDATLAAIARHGADVAMDDIAAEAGTSKTVLYRHFADREQLYLAVSARVADELLPRLGRAVARNANHPRQLVAAAIDAYLAFVEADPELYRFVVHGFPQAQLGQFGRSDDSNPIGSLSDVVARQASVIITDLLSAAGRDTAAAEPWGHAVVGLVRSAADWWLRADQPMPRSELAAHLTDLAWSGLSAVMQPLQENR
ncbi:MAG: TetR family transcriptional regulator [Nakamurella sp.]